MRERRYSNCKLSISFFFKFDSFTYTVITRLNMTAQFWRLEFLKVMQAHASGDATNLRAFLITVYCLTIFIEITSYLIEPEQSTSWYFFETRCISLRKIWICLFSSSPSIRVTSTRVVPAQWLCHFRHFNRSCLFLYVCTKLLWKLCSYALNPNFCTGKHYKSYTNFALCFSFYRSPVTIWL